jgi:hypothetical protein
MTVNKIESCLTFGRAGRLRNIARYSKPVAVLHQHVADVAQPALLAVALAIELGIGVGRAGMGFVRTLLPAEVALPIAPALGRLA